MKTSIIYTTAIILGVILEPTTGTTIKFSFAEGRPALDSLLFLDNVLWVVERASEVKCVQLCVDSDGCASFTFSRRAGSSVTLCRAHSKVMTSLDNATKDADSRYYVITNTGNWQGSECSVDELCPAKNSQCFDGQCVCVPGYFYSVLTHTCCPECKSLGSGFVEYPGYHMVGYSNLTIYGSFEWEKCFQYCLLSEVRFKMKCSTVELDFAFASSSAGWKKCVLSPHTPLTITDPSHWRLSGPGENWTIFQRVCEDDFY
ncbi:hypothetical protein BaRGS_00018616 [Batillaria attramentaria]|uniref:Apple domain-containing protein n=1 Tax=Batillaria attramentaria TaxID=370345 RepID=A0ABD0KS99_9CAEN